jgi:phosphohistidine phosphatase
MTTVPPRRLVVLRHAKSAWPAVPDHRRPLAARGRRDAPAVGRALRDGGYLPDRVLCSTAERTRQTWDLVAGELGAAPPVEWDDRIYDASVDGLLAVLRDVPDGVGTVLLVGHNPGVQELTLALAGDAQSDTARRVWEKFPTSAFAVLSLSGNWSDLAPGVGELVEFAVPRG